jgi:hypothetical protein
MIRDIIELLGEAVPRIGCGSLAFWRLTMTIGGLIAVLVLLLDIVLFVLGMVDPKVAGLIAGLAVAILLSGYTLRDKLIA